MHPYLPHLLADIKAAHRTELPLPEHVESFEDHMKDVENWIAGDEAPHTLGYWCGLKKEDFPPAEQLCDKDKLLVCAALNKMMFSWNIGIDLPEKLPVPLKYDFIVGALNEKTAIPKAGMLHFDFCSGNAPDCVFKEFCSCLKYWNESDNDISDPEKEIENPY